MKTLDSTDIKVYYVFYASNIYNKDTLETFMSGKNVVNILRYYRIEVEEQVKKAKEHSIPSHSGLNIVLKGGNIMGGVKSIFRMEHFRYQTNRILLCG